jgi:hypothetical protein
MSTFTRTTTPAYSANPFQAFVTYKQAVRAAKGAGVVALVHAGLSALGFIPVMASPTLPPLIKLVSLAMLAAMVVLLLLVAWRAWVRPGPWKAGLVLLVGLLNLAALFVQFSILNAVLTGVMLIFSVVAFRGALALKRLAPKAAVDVEVFS